MQTHQKPRTANTKYVINEVVYETEHIFGTSADGLFLAELAAEDYYENQDGHRKDFPVIVEIIDAVDAINNGKYTVELDCIPVFSATTYKEE